MIHEEICTYEVCKLAEEKEFPQHIGNDAYIVENEGDDEYEVGCCYPIEFIPEDLEIIAAPTQSLLQRWLREEKFIDIEIYPIFINGVRAYTARMYAPNLNKSKKFNYFDTYEFTLEDALKYALENLI